MEPPPGHLLTIFGGTRTNGEVYGTMCVTSTANVEVV